MSDTKGRTRQEGPFDAFEPVIILDVVRIRENGIEGEEWEGVKICVCRQSFVQSCTSYFRRFDLDSNPI